MKTYDLKAICKFVESYEKQGVDTEVALQAAVFLARGIYKRDHPNISKMPDHLKPGNVVKSFNAERRGAIGTPGEAPQTGKQG